MADDDLLVTISGPALSLLLYENTRIPDQIGFLLGEVLAYVSKKVTDSERDVEHTKHHIHIKTVVAYPISKPFFDSIGQIDEKLLNDFLQDNLRKVVGWFQYRQESNLKPTFRDQCIHKSMSEYFPKINKMVTKDNFIMCILNSTKNETGGTYKFKYMLMRKYNKILKPVPLKINNLGVDATRPDGSDYKPTPTVSSSKSDSFDIIYEKIKNDLSSAGGIQAVALIQHTAEQFLEKLIPEVNESDQELSKLEEQLFHLRNNYFKEEYRKLKLAEELEHMELDSSSSKEPKHQFPTLIDLQGFLRNGDVFKIKQTIKLIPEPNEQKQTRDEKSNEKDFLTTSPGEDKNVSPAKSNDSNDTLFSESPTLSTVINNKNINETRRQRTDEFPISPVVSQTQSPTTNRGLTKSPEYLCETLD